MKILLMFILQLPSVYAADAIRECGIYKVAGIIRIINDGPFIIINEHSMSEYIISIPISEEPQLAPYINRDLSLVITIDRPFNGYKGHAINIHDTQLRIPNPLREKTDTSMQLIKKLPCQKK